MSESKRKERLSPQEKLADQITEDMADQGKLIMVGWMAFRTVMIPNITDPDMIENYRISYLAGAEHTYSSLFKMLEEGAMETEQDLTRMAMLDKEIQIIREYLQAYLARTAGSA